MTRKNTEDFCCQICQKICRSKSGVDSHMRWHTVWKQLEVTESGRVKCLDCEKSYSSIDTARRHYKFLHMTDKNDNVCKKGFAIKDYLNRHVKSVHFSPQMTSKLNQRRLKPNKHGGVTCQNCKKDFSSMKNAKRHYIRQHISKKMFKCKVCKKDLSNESNMIRHMRAVHGSTEGWMVIDVSPMKKLFKVKKI